MYYEVNEQLHGITPYNSQQDEAIYFSYFEKDPNEWITGTETMSVEQRIYLKTLSEEAGVAFDGSLSKVSAIERIKELQQKISRKL
jgi:hypothetical protein